MKCVQKWLYGFIVCGAVSSSVLAVPSAAPLTLSLEEAILLATRENPHVQVQQLNEVQQKFALYVQQWMFKPHFGISASYGETNSVIGGDRQPTIRTAIVTPTVNLLSPLGTQVSLSPANSLANVPANSGVSFQIVQPLIRGFGKPVVEAALFNAMDSERIAHLTTEGTLRTTVTNVIAAYLAVVSAEYTVKIDEDALSRVEHALQQTEALIKAGHKAGNEIVTVEAEVASAQTALINDRNNLQQMRYALLTAIGVDPNMPVRFTSLNVSKLIRKYHVPSLVETKMLTLQNDIQYQIDQVTFYGITQRNLLVAKDNARWQLNVSANAQSASLSNGTNKSNSLMVNLLIPIDDKAAQQAIVNAKIAIRQGAEQLKQEKWSKETSAINGWNTIFSAERAVVYAEKAERLQEKTYYLTHQKYLYGMIDSLELQTAQQQLNSARQALVSAKINYLTALVNIDLLIGNTLNTWNIKLRNPAVTDVR